MNKPLPASHAAPPAAHPSRGDAARERLLGHATRIFAAKGFAGAATREICEAAGVNVASIHYYFGDKEGLYREVLMRPIVEMAARFGRFDDPALSFRQAIGMFIAPFLDAVASDDADDAEVQVMRVHLREMLEPTPAFREITAQLIAPIHQALAGLLARHCGLRRADTDIHQLAFAIAAMANDYCMSREFMKMLAPDVLARPQAVQRILERLVDFAAALLQGEQARRAATKRKPPASKVGSKIMPGLPHERRR